MPRVRWLYPTMVLVLALADARADHASDAQDVADLQRILEGHRHTGLDTGEDQRRLDRAVDRWLRGELAKLGSEASDRAIAQVKLIVVEAAKRGRADIAAEARARGDAMIEQRGVSVAADLEAGRYLSALQTIEGWTSGDAGIGLATRRRLRAKVADAVAAARARATTPPERYLYARMGLWLDEPARDAAAVADDQAMTALATTAIHLDRTSSGCPVATSLAHASDAAGTPIAIKLALGGCDAHVSVGTATRTHTYIAKVPATRQEPYTVMEHVEHQEPVIGSESCGQDTHDISGGSGPRNTVTSSHCEHPVSTKTVSSEEPVTHYRTVNYLEDVSTDETYAVDTFDYAAELPIELTISGDGETVSASDGAHVEEHTESGRPAHGSPVTATSASEVRTILMTRLDARVQSAVDAAIHAWMVKRGRTRLSRAQRPAAIEAVRIAPELAPDASTLVGIGLAPTELAALIAGQPRVVAIELTAPGIELPPVSTDLEARIALLETRHDRLAQARNMDGLFGVGLGFQSVGGAHHTTFALEDQFGFVPSFVATSNLIARLDFDLQIGFASNPLVDLAVRPELGFRLGMLSVGAVATAGVHASYQQPPDDSDATFGDTAGYGYVGYGAHASLAPGPLILDALAMVLLPSGDPPRRSRVDAIIGYQPGEYGLYYMVRVRYEAESELTHPFNGMSHYASGIAGVLVQF